MKKYYKFIIILLVISFFVPQVALASWWNPFSWNWNFKSWFKSPSQTQTQILEKRIKDLEDKLNNQSNTSTEVSEKSDIPKEIVYVPVNTPAKNTNQTQQNSLTNEQVVQKVKPAVVYVETPSGSGSGFIIDSNGYILTNFHIIQGATSIKVKLSDDRSFFATLIGTDKWLDLAMLKINSSGLPFIDMGNSDISSLKQGENVYSFGWPFGYEGEVSFKEGTLSRRLLLDGKKWLEMSTEIHPGNSGGPLINKLGQVIGVNTRGAGSEWESKGTGVLKLAIPSNEFKNYIYSLKTGTHCSKISFKKLPGDFEFDLTNDGPNEIQIDHLVLAEVKKQKTSTKDGNFLSFRFMDIDTNQKFQILQGTRLLPGKSIRFYTSQMNVRFTGIMYEPGSITDLKTGNYVVFNSFDF